MDKLCIQGGRPLFGDVVISGAKNSALPILCAGILTDQPVTFNNVPPLNDIQTMLRLLAQMGIEIEVDQETVKLNAADLNKPQAPYELVKTMRASILVLGPLLARFGRAKVSLPGGCAIGARPVDLHIKALQAMGAVISVHQGYIEATVDRLKGASIVFDMPTVTGTENLMMAACLADGETILENAAREPEIVDLADCLIGMGAVIEGAGTDRIRIVGQEKLSGTTHRVMADRIEAGTFLCAAAATGGRVRLLGAQIDHLEAVVAKLVEAGCEVVAEKDTITITSTGKLKAVSFRTSPHPAFPTDMQAQFMAINCVAEGSAMISETIFENRFMHAQELIRMGADIQINGATAVVNGVEKLEGTQVMATDLRASASLVIAGLVACNQTVIDRIYHLDRGYHRLEDKLSELGALIRRIQ